MESVNKIKFITCIYTKLNGTTFGGQLANRIHRYKFSLLALLNMTNADFLCYTSEEEIEDLQSFFYTEHNISKKQLNIKIFDLDNTKLASLINKNKNITAVKSDYRCYEIQYSKFSWWWDEDKSYDFYYWIDAGLSCIDLIPPKLLNQHHTAGLRKYYDCSLFNNLFLNNLVNASDDKFLLLGKENIQLCCSGTVPEKWYKNYDRSLHIIGGLFGGSVNMWDNIVTMFEDYTSKIVTEDNVLYYEELIMSIMYVDNSSNFNVIEFDSWHHADSGIHDKLFFEDKKSFYEIVTDLNK